MSGCMRLPSSAATATKASPAAEGTALLLAASARRGGDRVRVEHARDDLIAFVQAIEHFGVGAVRDAGLDGDGLEHRFAGFALSFVDNVDGAADRAIGLALAITAAGTATLSKTGAHLFAFFRAH